MTKEEIKNRRWLITKNMDLLYKKHSQINKIIQKFQPILRKLNGKDLDDSMEELEKLTPKELEDFAAEANSNYINGIMEELRQKVQNDMETMERCENCYEKECQINIYYKGETYKMMNCLPETYDNLPKKVKEEMGI